MAKALVALEVQAALEDLVVLVALASAAPLARAASVKEALAAGVKLVRQVVLPTSETPIKDLWALEEAEVALTVWDQPNSRTDQMKAKEED